MKTTHTLLLAAATAAVGLAAASVANAGPAPKPGFKFEKCFGVAASGQNDCQTATHSCAGESRRAAAGDSWIYVPVGTCMKISGGTLAAK